jgi:hypothetical protein
MTKRSSTTVFLALIALALTLASTLRVRAQTVAPDGYHDHEGLHEVRDLERASVFGGYEIGLGSRDLHDFIGDPSFKGFELGGLYPVARGLHVGLYMNSRLFEEARGTTTIALSNGALSGDFYRYARFWSTGAAARYYFLRPDHFVRPYIGVRLGVSFMTATTLLADREYYETPVGFTVAPEVGFAFRVLPLLSVSLAARYDFSTLDARQIDNASYAAFHFGLIVNLPD